MVQRIGVRVEYTVHRFAEGNKIKNKNERREMTRDAVFVGWVDTGIDWCYDWHQRTLNCAYYTTLAKPDNA